MFKGYVFAAGLSIAVLIGGCADDEDSVGTGKLGELVDLNLGAPTVLVTGLSGPNGIAADATGVYFTADDDTVSMAPLIGGTAVVLASAQENAEAIALDDSAIYWVNTMAGTVEKRSKADGAMTTLATGQDGPYRLALSDSTVYWTTLFGDSVASVAKTGGAATTLATDMPGPEGVAVDAQFLYTTNADNGTVTGMPLAGGALTTFAAAQDTPDDVAIDTTHVYWTFAGGVARAAKAGSEVTPVATSLGDPGWIIERDAYVYFTDVDLGLVLRAPKVGGAAQILASQQASPHGIAEHAGVVYWCNNNDGTIRSVALPE